MLEYEFLTQYTAVGELNRSPHYYSVFKILCVNTQTGLK